jgi:hypothetical protein
MIENDEVEESIADLSEISQSREPAYGPTYELTHW